MPCRATVNGRSPNVGAVKDDATGIRREHAIDEIEQGRFAGAVRPDQPEDFALALGEGQIVHGKKPAETLADAIKFEKRRHSSTFCRRGKRL